MFEKLGRLAEMAVDKVSLSRRGFLGRLGQGALAGAGVLGGLLALSNKAHGGAHDLYLCSYSPKNGHGCYEPFCPSGTTALQSCGSCPPIKCCNLASKTIIGTC